MSEFKHLPEIKRILSNISSYDYRLALLRRVPKGNEFLLSQLKLSQPLDDSIPVEMLEAKNGGTTSYFPIPRAITFVATRKTKFVGALLIAINTGVCLPIAYWIYKSIPRGKAMVLCPADTFTADFESHPVLELYIDS